jgi:hypothetical protein
VGGCFLARDLRGAVDDSASFTGSGILETISRRKSNVSLVFIVCFLLVSPSSETVKGERFGTEVSWRRGKEGESEKLGRTDDKQLISFLLSYSLR